MACLRQVTQAAAAQAVCAQVLHLSLPAAQLLRLAPEELQGAVRLRALMAAPLRLLLLLLQAAAAAALGAQ